MLHHRSTRSFAILLTGLSVLSACTTNDSALEPEQTETSATVESIDPLTTNSANPEPALQQESSSTVESTDPPTTNPINPATSLHGVETGMNDSSDDSRDRGLYLPRLLDSILVDHPSGQQPVVSTDDVPPSILASTEACEIVMIDAATGESTKLWKYQHIGYTSAISGAYISNTPFYYCEPIPDDIESILPPNYESGPSFPEDLEWVDTGYVLISMCCEPAVGRFELLAMPGTSETEEPIWLALQGRFPNIDDDGSLVFLMGGNIGFEYAYPIVVIEEFDINSDNASSPEYPSYGFTGDQSYYGLSFDQEDTSSGIRGVIGNVSWLDNDRIAFDLWSFDSNLPGSDVFSWIGVIDLTQQSVSLNSRSPGWSTPTGDELGNFVVSEQPCNFYFGTCDQDRSIIVTLDSHTLLPIHELEVDGNIADMDLVRGWLLITLTDGRMGTIDFTTGEFSVIADGITHAVWME